MQIYINDTEYSFDKEISIINALHFLNLNTEGVAIAVNFFVVAKKEWASYLLQNNDKVMIIKATQGG